ncbi:MAG: hypothetical protein WBG90_02120 [Saonia sp.]
MKPKYFLSMLLITIVIHVTWTQQKESPFYRIEKGDKIHTTSFTDITESLQFEERSQEDSIPKPFSGILSSLVVNELVPLLIKKVPNLFYRPEKFIKEYGTSLDYFEIESQSPSIKNWDKVNLVYVKEGIQTDFPGQKEMALSKFEFQIDAMEGHDLKGYSTLALSAYEVIHTPVKLRAKHNKVNIVIQITFHYFDDLDNKKAHQLQSIHMYGITPSEVKILDMDTVVQHMQIIPPMKIIEKIDVKITEVNTRKKDWDKWLELYNANQGKLNDYFLEIVAQ